jgi:hypothetical protein
MFVVAWGTARLWTPTLAQPPAALVLTLSESRVYTLEELTQRMREEAEVEVYADRRYHARRVFVSEGTYEASSLLKALRLATGMSLRTIGEIRFLDQGDLTFGGRLVFPLLPRALLQRLGQSLRPMAERVDLRQEGIPFETSEFLAGKSVPWAQLTPEQQKFVVKAAQFIPLQDIGQPGLGRLEIDDATLQQRLQELREARVRLGTSYLMAFTVYQPAPSPTERDARGLLELFQVYYDYRDRLSPTPPEE